MRHETGSMCEVIFFTSIHRVGLPEWTGHDKLKLITSPQTGRFPVKVILLLTVCLKADRLQESL